VRNPHWQERTDNVTDRIATDILAELISQKHEVLEQMRQLIRQQTNHIDSGDTTQLLTLLGAKQRLLNMLHEVEKQLSPFRSEDPDSRIWRSQQDRQRCQQTAARCQTLLDEIMLLEKQCESEMVLRRDETAERLQGVHSADKARQAYAQNHQPMSSSFDLTSD
jgi:flagellar biosynthesis/type III secretory pathway chaperone